MLYIDGGGMKEFGHEMIQQEPHQALDIELQCGCGAERSIAYYRHSSISIKAK
jgi:hypothetical protein